MFELNTLIDILIYYVKIANRNRGTNHVNGESAIHGLYLIFQSPTADQ